MSEPNRIDARFAALRDEYRKSFYESMRLAMKTHGIDYVPGCVELGDFDATSTAVAVFPCDELGLVPDNGYAHGRAFRGRLDHQRRRKLHGLEDELAAHRWAICGSGHAVLHEDRLGVRLVHGQG